MTGTRLGRRASGQVHALCATVPPPERKDLIPRVAFTIAETARMLGKNATALRRECERRARREGDRVVADLALGIRAHKHGRRWFVVVPRELLA